MVVLGLQTHNEYSQEREALAPAADDNAAALPETGSSVRNDELAGQLLASIQRHVTVGEPFNDLAEELSHIRTHLSQASGSEDPLQAAQKVDRLLENLQSRTRDINRDTANDFRKLLDLVNESFVCMQAGNQRSDSRLRYLEQSLGQAAKIDSLVSLRRHLSGVLDFVQQEEKRDLHERGRLPSMTDELQKANEANKRFRVAMPGRAQALDYFKQLLAAPNENNENNVTLFAADSLKALRARHGDNIASEILEELGRKQLQPLAPAGKLFCWSGTSLALTWRHTFASTSAGLLSSSASTFEHRAFVGTRVATFKITLRSASTPVAGEVEDVVSALDRFARERSA